MNNFEMIKECKTLKELAIYLAKSDLREMLVIKQPISDVSFYAYWLLQGVEE